MTGISLADPPTVPARDDGPPRIALDGARHQLAWWAGLPRSARRDRPYAR